MCWEELLDALNKTSRKMGRLLSGGPVMVPQSLSGSREGHRAALQTDAECRDDAVEPESE